MWPCVGMMSAEDACYQTQSVLLYIYTLHSCRLCNQLAGAEALLDLMVDSLVLKLSMAVYWLGVLYYSTRSYRLVVHLPRQWQDRRKTVTLYYSPNFSNSSSRSCLSLSFPFFLSSREEWSYTAYNNDNSVTGFWSLILSSCYRTANTLPQG